MAARASLWGATVFVRSNVPRTSVSRRPAAFGADAVPEVLAWKITASPRFARGNAQRSSDPRRTRRLQIHHCRT